MSYIERSVALNAIQNIPSAGGCAAIDRDDAENAVMTIPAADVVEVKHGYWLSAYEYSLKFDISEERRDEVKNDTVWKFCCLCDQSAKWEYDYCPNCGANMDGERSENGT